MTSGLIPLSDSDRAYWNGVLRAHQPAKSYACWPCGVAKGSCPHQTEANITLAMGGDLNFDMDSGTFVKAEPVVAEPSYVDVTELINNILRKCPDCDEVLSNPCTDHEETGQVAGQPDPGEMPSHWHGRASTPDTGQIMAS